jgi:hypothetical protein
MSNDKTKAAEAVSRVPNERLEDLFSDAIRAKLTEEGCELSVQEFDVTVRKELDQSAVFVDMQVYGMAGDTTKDDFAKVDGNGNVQVVKGGGSVSVKLDDDSVVRFVFNGIVNLNATDYLVTYRLA